MNFYKNFFWYTMGYMTCFLIATNTAKLANAPKKFEVK